MSNEQKGKRKEPCTPEEITAMQAAIAAGEYLILEKTFAATEEGTLHPILCVEFPALSRKIWLFGFADGCCVMTKNYLRKRVNLDANTILTVNYDVVLPSECEAWLPVLWEMVSHTISTYRVNQQRLDLYAPWVPEEIGNKLGDAFQNIEREYTYVRFDIDGISMYPKADAYINGAEWLTVTTASNEIVPPEIVNRHTHGLEKFDHLDFQMIINYHPREAARLLNTMATRVKNGERFSPGDMVDGLYQDCLVRLDLVTEGGRDVLRLIIPDPENRWPEDPGCIEPLKFQTGHYFEELEEGEKI